MEHKARHIPDYKDIIEEENGEEGGAEVCQLIPFDINTNKPKIAKQIGDLIFILRCF